MQKVSVTITEDLQYYVDDKKVTINQLEARLRSAFSGKEGVVVLHCDKTVPVEKLVEVAGIATALEARVSIATRPN